MYRKLNTVDDLVKYLESRKWKFYLGIKIL
jgi:hypothetical protein